MVSRVPEKEEPLDWLWKVRVLGRGSATNEGGAVSVADLTLCVPDALDSSSTGRGEHCCMTVGKGRG